MARSGWYKVKGKWTRTLGERGCRVRLFQMTKGGTFYRDHWIPGGARDRRSLCTTDRANADQLGRALIAALRQPNADLAPKRLTLGDLWERYRTDCRAYLARSKREHADARSRAEVLIAHFGPKCDARDLTVDDVAAYRAARQAGGIRVSETRTTQRVRGRSVVADIALLQGMLNWARTTRVDGVRLLDVNPIAGVRTARDPHPRRPVATWDRFLATRTAVQELAREATVESDRRRWIKAELALVLAESTGRRLGSIRRLRWEDIHWEHQTIRWSAQFDKKRKEWVVPVPDGVLKELRHFQRLLGAVGGWIFASETTSETLMDRDAFKRLLERAERRAGLPKLDGGLWHPYRRKWATERKHLSLTDVAAAGGWKNTATLLTCYQQPTNDALLAVMSEERKVRDVAVVDRT
jgi:integrase